MDRRRCAAGLTTGEASSACTEPSRQSLPQVVDEPDEPDERLLPSRPILHRPLSPSPRRNLHRLDFSFDALREHLRELQPVRAITRLSVCRQGGAGAGLLT